jgi:hypothetical protein
MPLPMPKEEPDEPFFNVYRVYFYREEETDSFEAIALVLEGHPDQEIGKVLQLLYNEETGCMTYLKRERVNFGEHSQYHRSELQFRIPISQGAKLEQIAENNPTALISKNLLEWNPELRTKQCSIWANSILNEAAVSL